MSNDSEKLAAAYQLQRDRAIGLLVSKNAYIEQLHAELTAYWEAALYDTTMEGPKFKGWNRSALDRARHMTEERVGGFWVDTDNHNE